MRCALVYILLSNLKVSRDRRGGDDDDTKTQIRGDP